MKRLAAASLVLAGLSACTLLDPLELTADAPQVVTIDPPNGASQVPLDAALRAELNLPGGAVDLTTLSEASVTLTEESGAPVAATRTLEDGGSTLVVSPEAPLQPATTYRFSVTSALRDEVGTPFEAFTSTFSTTDEALGDVGTLTVRNPLEIPFDDRLVLHRINDTSGNLCWPPDDPGCDAEAEPWADLVYVDTGVLQLENTGEAPLELTLTLSSPADFTLPGGESELVLDPGESYDLTVQFIHAGDEMGIIESYLELQDARGASTQIELAGIYQLRPEGNREIFLEGIVRGFGYTTELGTDARGGLTSTGPDAPLAGDEVRSAYWRPLDASLPVRVTQIAAFHSCCTQGDTFEAFEQGASTPLVSFRNDGAYSQTIFPLAEGTDEVARAEFEPSGPFEMRSANYSTDPSLGAGGGRFGFRLWPAKDREGEVIPGTYIAAQDYVSTGDCMETPLANCDFNDNMYLIENVAPVD
ncbi:Ig-like domain-containing protein [Truepera radiovictrix]|uniref:PA14 domain protein n=1 Tax=Truepera radiovictrix (strain DSM 17093 / CIP 108686 / LMG 22925 / RQ-24) TaxID=649638 RepID=D7CQB5_TRURR|nr:Ig-like domain-containing protein [Truepera radiovictrix]ADI14899.1 PA14 domain protein [Truepera radiovictrix DSM 17093]WMT56549.1 Ig-like domain-containing protein [Truepera radiovictrix]